MDLLVVWPVGDGDEQRFAVERKLVKAGRSLERAVDRGRAWETLRFMRGGNLPHAWRPCARALRAPSRAPVPNCGQGHQSSWGRGDERVSGFVTGDDFTFRDWCHA